MPSAPPNSLPVFSNEEAVPARSAGALLIARSVSWDVTMTTPLASTPAAAGASQRESVPASASSAKPAAPTAKPQATRSPRKTPRWTSCVVTGPATPMRTDGSRLHSAASGRR